MNFLNLQYFVMLSEELNFSRSASRLYISQQSLSAHIHKLEAEYGLPLFYRDPPLRLTEAGREFLKSAKVILSEKEHLEKQLLDLRDFRQGNIVIGVPVSRGTILLPRVLQAFHQEFPHIKVHLREGTSNEILEALLNGETDLNLGFEREPNEKITSERLYRESTHILVPKVLLDAMPRREELLAFGDPIPLKAFASCPFVTLSESTMTGKVLHTIAEKEGFIPQIVMDTRNLLTMLALCGAGIGACICPNSFLTGDSPLLQNSFLQRVSIFPLQADEVDQWIVVDRLKNKYFSRAEKYLLQSIKDLYGKE